MMSSEEFEGILNDLRSSLDELSSLRDQPVHVITWGGHVRDICDRLLACNLSEQLATEFRRIREWALMLRSDAAFVISGGLDSPESLERKFRSLFDLYGRMRLHLGPDTEGGHAEPDHVRIFSLASCILHLANPQWPLMPTEIIHLRLHARLMRGLAASWLCDHADRN